MAASVPKNSPPSEKESGVTFSTPMIIPRLERSTTWSPIFQSRSVIKIQTNTTPRLFEASSSDDYFFEYLRVSSHQFALREDVALHCGIDFLAFRARFQVEHLIKREDFEIVT